MEIFVHALGGVELNARSFLHLKNLLKISWLLVSGTSRRWTQRRDVENIPLGNVATLVSNITTLKIYLSGTS